MVISNANEIIKNLWLGDYISALDINFHKKYNISVIINCSKDLKFSNDVIYKYRVPVSDNLKREEIIRMTDYIKKIIPIINTHIKEGRVVLVHCAAGMQRSAIVVLSYLYKYVDNDIGKNIKLMKTKRPIVFTPAMNFKYSICKALNVIC